MLIAADVTPLRASGRRIGEVGHAVDQTSARLATTARAAAAAVGRSDIAAALDGLHARWVAGLAATAQVLAGVSAETDARASAFEEADR